MKVIERCVCVRGGGAGPVTRSSLMVVMGDSMVIASVCLMEQMQSWSGVARTSSVEMGVWMAWGWRAMQDGV